MSDIYEDIKSRIRLSSIIRQYVPSLKPVGNDDFRGLCPFHNEKTPSFLVHDRDGYYKCFGCGVSGDSVKFIEEFEQISHVDALKRMKAEAGIEDAFMTPTQKRAFEADRKNRINRMNAFRKWKACLISDLINYTNAQWHIHRIAARQAAETSTEELYDQIEKSRQEATSREKALDQLESMPESELLEWFESRKSWEGVKNPRWVLTGWRKAMASGTSTK